MKAKQGGHENQHFQYIFRHLTRSAFEANKTSKFIGFCLELTQQINWKANKTSPEINNNRLLLSFDAITLYI